MPAFIVTAAEDGVTIAVTPPLAGVTPSFGPLCTDQNVEFAAGSVLNADSLTVVCTGRFGQPALTLAAGKPDIVFQVDLGDGSTPAVYGPMQPTDAAQAIAAGPPGAAVPTATVTAMTAAEAHAKGLI